MHLKNLIKNVLSSLFLAAALVIISAGCDTVDEPVSSNRYPADEWSNPGRGFEIVPGREVPFLNDNYWDSLYGPQVNPFGLGAASRIIGRAGGTLTCGLHSYTVPPEALTGPVRMTLAYASLNTVVVACGPSPFSFNVPVTLRMSYEGTSYDNDLLDPLVLDIWYMNPDGTLEAMDGIVDSNSRTISAQVDHFSRYIIG